MYFQSMAVLSLRPMAPTDLCSALHSNYPYQGNQLLTVFSTYLFNSWQCWLIYSLQNCLFSWFPDIDPHSPPTFLSLDSYSPSRVCCCCCCFLCYFSFFSSLFTLQSLLEWIYPPLHLEIKSVVDDGNSPIYTPSLDFSSALVLYLQVLPGHISIGTPSHHDQTKLILFPNSTSQSTYQWIILAMQIWNRTGVSSSLVLPCAL